MPVFTGLDLSPLSVRELLHTSLSFIAKDADGVMNKSPWWLPP